MADMAVRSCRNSRIIVKIGDCVSVARNYFGLQYGALLPDHIQRIIGRVTYVHDTNACNIKWDIDDTESTNVKNININIEPINSPHQQLEIIKKETETELSLDNELSDEVVETGAILDDTSDSSDSDVDDDILLQDLCKVERKSKRRKRPISKKPSKEKVKIVDSKKRKREEVESEDENILDVEDSEDTDNESMLERKAKRRKRSISKKPSEKVKIVVSKKRKREEVESEEENILDADSEDTDDESMLEKNKSKKMLDEESKIWRIGGWKIDPRSSSGAKNFNPQLRGMPMVDNAEPIDFFMHFAPLDFVKNVIISSMNQNDIETVWNDVDFEEFVRFLGIMYSMQIYRLPERRMYWRTEDIGPFKALNYGQYMTLTRFETIMKYFLSSPKKIAREDEAEYKDGLIIQLINAFNKTMNNVFVPGHILTVDESMVKSYHRNLKGKIKIIRKPRPIGNEFKNVCCGLSKIVVRNELYEGKELMKGKDYVGEYGATTATTLRLTEPWKCSGRIVLGDSWFGSVKTAVELMNSNGLHSILLVKTAHKNYPRATLGSSNLTRGTWNSATGTVNNVPLLAVKFQDLKDKQFISTCSTDIAGPPRQTRHYGLVKRPLVAYDYLSHAAGIDIYNHFRTGSCGLEDVWRTKSPHIRQFAGVFSFVFTNAYLAMKYFKEPNLDHNDFKTQLASALIEFTENRYQKTRGADALKHHTPNNHVTEMLHVPVALGKRDDGSRALQKNCYFCQHGRIPPVKKVKTTFMCSTCDIPLCSPTATSRDCWVRHIAEGKPKKKYQKK